MKKETKVVISSDNVVVNFNPNDADHEEALNKANADSISNKVEFQRKLAYFEDLMRKAAQSRHGAPWDMSKEIDNFTKATGIELSVAQLIKACDYSLEGKLEVYLKEILASKQTSVVGLKVGDTIKSWDGTDIPIVAIHAHCPKSLFKTFEHRINTRNDFSVGIPDRLEIVWPQDRFNADFPAIREAINSLKTVLSENGYMDVRRSLVGALNNTYGLKSTIQDFVNLIEGNCSPIDFVLKNQYNAPLLQAKAGEDKSSALMVTDPDGMVCFRKPGKLLPGDKIMSFTCRSSRPDKQEGVRTDSNIRYWYDKFGVGHEIPPNKPMEAGSVKRNGSYGAVSQPSSNGGPIPSPDPRDETVKGKDIVIQNNVSISPGKVNIKALEAACRTMAEIMKHMHPKPVFNEFRDKVYEALASAYLNHDTLRGTTSREFLYGDVLWIERFKCKFGIVFSIEDMNLFLDGRITASELFSKYVPYPYSGEKKITTYGQYALALNTLTSLLCLFPPNVRTREDIERAKALHVQFNIRFDIDMSEEDFLAIIYRHGTPRHFLKKHATTEATKGE